MLLLIERCLDIWLEKIWKRSQMSLQKLSKRLRPSKLRDQLPAPIKCRKCQGDLENISCNPLLHINPIRICSNTWHLALGCHMPGLDKITFYPLCPQPAALRDMCTNQSTFSTICPARKTKVKVNHSARFSLITKMIFPIAHPAAAAAAAAAANAPGMHYRMWV